MDVTILLWVNSIHTTAKFAYSKNMTAKQNLQKHFHRQHLGTLINAIMAVGYIELALFAVALSVSFLFFCNGIFQLQKVGSSICRISTSICCEKTKTASFVYLKDAMNGTSIKLNI
uniref:Uncharacterized protein n=2 Tax=Aegilops tauschii subsp. strangulata TaxID=200361 RepID=A0A452YAR9_AEGTS